MKTNLEIVPMGRVDILLTTKTIPKTEEMCDTVYDLMTNGWTKIYDGNNVIVLTRTQLVDLHTMH